jgi:hypothetical protein
MTAQTDRIESTLRRDLVLDLPHLTASVGDRSRASLFRDLSKLQYLSSYTHSGCYYTLRDIPAFDLHGLWFFHGIGFSRDGTLRATVAGLVDASKAGYVHEELASLVRVRVHNTLRDLASTGQIQREGFRRHYVYLSADLSRAEEQRELRAQRVAGEIAAEPTARTSEPVQRETVIAVLVEALHIANMRVNSKLVAKRLEIRGLLVSPEQVEQILGRYGLGKKKPEQAPLLNSCKD